MPAVPCMKLVNDLAGVRAKAASAVTRPPPSATAASSSRSMTPSPHCRMLRFRRWPQLGSAGCCAVEGAGLQSVHTGLMVDLAKHKSHSNILIFLFISSICASWLHHQTDYFSGFHPVHFSLIDARIYLLSQTIPAL